MEIEILKKKISTFRTEGGVVRGVSDEVLLEMLHAWEQWVGPAQDFARAIGLNRKAIPKLIGKAKKLKREGFPGGDFKELRVEESVATSGGGSGNPCSGIELGLPDGKLIRFPQVDQLLEFLKKAA
jgi:hypothetical protein